MFKCLEKHLKKKLLNYYVLDYTQAGLLCEQMNHKTSVLQMKGFFHDTELCLFTGIH